MAGAALVLYGVAMAVTIGLRVVVQLRRTGSTGLLGIPADAGTVERIAGLLFGLGLAAGPLAPLLALLDVVEPIPALDGTVGHVIGIVLAVSGIALTFAAQLAMGDSWRVGVNPDERTALVTGGPFGLVRNPIYSATTPTLVGLALMVPSPVAIASLVLLAIGLELQVRLIEEPYLFEVHGEEYATYASQVGRFLPGVGKLHGAAAQS